jgi:hypothetical protein
MPFRHISKEGMSKLFTLTKKCAKSLWNAPEHMADN